MASQNLSQEASWLQLQAGLQKIALSAPASAFGEPSDVNALKLQQEIQSGLLFAMLLAETEAHVIKYLDLVAIFQRDKYAWFCSLLRHMIADRFPKIQKRPLVFIFKVIIPQLLLREAAQPAFPELIQASWRWLSLGSGANPHLVDCVVDTLKNHTRWLYQNPMLISVVFYSLCGALLDMERSSVPHIAALREEAAMQCVRLWKERQADVRQLGRDLIRAVSNVPRLDPIQREFHSILAEQLKQRTSRLYTQIRLTKDMESQIVFIFQSVRVNFHARHFEWFKERHLSSESSDMLIPELVRFVVNTFHPDNKLLRSDFVPRWLFLGWLLRQCRGPVSASASKLALLYDWLYYVDPTDRFMNVEAPLLLMWHSLERNPDLTAELLEFMISHYDQSPIKDRVGHSIQKGLSLCLANKVIPYSSCCLIAWSFSQSLYYFW